MSLLFDQNISFKIIKKIEGIFPGSQQVKSLGLENKSDKEIWAFAKKHNYSIVTFDSDFYDLSIIWGSPPKIIWIRTNDQRTTSIEKLLKSHKKTIKGFIESSELACLEIIKTAPNNE